MFIPRFSGLIGLMLTVGLLAGCSVFHRRSPAPVVEAAPPPPAPTPPTAARDLAEAMTTVLRLRPDQTTRIRQMLSTTVAEANAAGQQYPAGSPALAAAQRRINVASDRQLRQILGPATYRQLQARQPQIQALMRGQ